MKPQLFSFLIFLILVSCKEKPVSTTHTTETLQEYTDSTSPFFELKEYFIKSDINYLASKDNHWSDIHSYFPVYRFKENIYGIVFEMEDGSTDKAFILDSFYALAVSKTNFYNGKNTSIEDSVYYDSYFSNLIEQNDTTKYFYVYGTKGFKQLRIGKNYIQYSSGCGQFIILSFANYDTTVLGNPVFCSKTPITFKYGSDKILEAELYRLKKIMDKHIDYTDSIQETILGMNDSLLITYSDDYTWWKNESSQCLFPSRAIYKKQSNKKYIRTWNASLDMFGIPCD